MAELTIAEIAWAFVKDNWKVILGGLAAGIIVGVVWRYVHLANEVPTLKATIHTQTVTIQNKDDAIKAVQDEHTAEVARHKRADDIKKEIYSAPPSADAAVAPVVRNALDGLRVNGNE